MRTLAKLVLCGLFTLMAAGSARAQIVLYNSQPFAVNPFGFATYSVSPFGLSGTGFGTYAIDGGLGGSTFTTFNAPTTFSTYSVRPTSFNNVQFTRFRSRLPGNTLIVPVQGGANNANNSNLESIKKQIDEVKASVDKLRLDFDTHVSKQGKKEEPDRPAAPGGVKPHPGLSSGASGGSGSPDTQSAQPPAGAPPGGPRVSPGAQMPPPLPDQEIVRKRQQMKTDYEALQVQIRTHRAVLDALKKEGKEASKTFKDTKALLDAAEKNANELRDNHFKLPD